MHTLRPICGNQPLSYMGA